MKICFVISNLECGGAQRVVSEFANLLYTLNNEVSIIQIFECEKPFYSIDKNVRIHSPNFNWKKKKFGLIKSFMLVRKNIMMIKPNIVLSFHQRYNGLVIASMLFTNIPIIVSDRSNPFNKLTPSLNEFLRNFLYPYASGFIVQTNLAAQVKDKLNKNIIVMPNPIKKLVDYDKNEKQNFIINVSTMVKGKGQEVLIKIFSLIKDIYPWKLLLVGDGPERSNLEKLSFELELQDSIIFAGKQENIELYLSQSKIFAFTSISEGYPNALLEAMGMGLACISFDCNGPSDLINSNENGILVKINDYDEYSIKLKMLMDNDELRMRLGKKALDVIESNDARKITDNLVNFIKTSII